MNNFDPKEMKLAITLDGSTTIQTGNQDECYHSKHGAIQESEHIFIKNGLEQMTQPNISILEIGVGTGLNVLLSLIHAKKKSLTVFYHGIEPFPLPSALILQLNYPERLKTDKNIFHKIHNTRWNSSEPIDKNFVLYKENNKIQYTDLSTHHYDLVYFDAFSPALEPELWQTSIFKKLFSSMKKEGLLLTYSSKGKVKRSMESAGFFCEKRPGPPGKREFLCGLKK